MVDTVHGAISLCRAERLNRTNNRKTHYTHSGVRETAAFNGSRTPAYYGYALLYVLGPGTRRGKPPLRVSNPGSMLCYSTVIQTMPGIMLV